MLMRQMKNAEPTKVAASRIATAPPPSDRVEPDPRKRSDDPQPFAGCCERAVGLCEQFLRQHEAKERRARGEVDRPADAVEERDEIDDPRIALVVDEEEQQDRAGEQEVDGNHQRPLADAVREQAGQGAEERTEPEDHEDEPGGGRRARQRLHPHGEHDEHRPVAKGGERLPGEEQACVAVGEELLHQAARKTRTSPLIVRPRTTTVGPPLAARDRLARERHLG